jgi:hypothetical protein
MVVLVIVVVVLVVVIVVVVVVALTILVGIGVVKIRKADAYILLCCCCCCCCCCLLLAACLPPRPAHGKEWQHHLREHALISCPIYVYADRAPCEWQPLQARRLTTSSSRKHPCLRQGACVSMGADGIRCRDDDDDDDDGDDADDDDEDDVEDRIDRILS